MQKLIFGSILWKTPGGIFFTLLVEAIFLILAAMSDESMLLNPNEPSTDNMLGSWHFKGDKNVARTHVSACAIDHILNKARQTGYLWQRNAGSNPGWNLIGCELWVPPCKLYKEWKKHLLSLLGAMAALPNWLVKHKRDWHVLVMEGGKFKVGFLGREPPTTFP